jgi:hypothetical protein
MQELFDKVNVREHHSPTAISFELQFIKSVTKILSGDVTAGKFAESYPSLISLASNSRYAFHLSPMTFPHEKHLTGIICEHEISLCATQRVSATRHGGGMRDQGISKMEFALLTS